MTKDNFDFNIDELIEFVALNKFEGITVEPDLINVLDIDSDEICSKLMEIYKKGKQAHISVEGFWKRPYNNMGHYRDSRNGFCRALDFKSIVVDKNGYMSPCGYSKLKISKIIRFEDLVKDETYIQFISNNLRGSIERCRGCKIEGVCKGGCLISREANQADNKIFLYRCNIYLKMTELLLRDSAYEGIE